MPFTILVVGDENVGKTSLITRYLDDLFLSTTQPTIGIIDYPLPTNNQIIIRDSPGSYRFKLITQRYYKHAQLILICFDLTNLKSFNNVVHYLNFAKALDSKPTLFLVGTKADSHSAVSDEQLKRLCEKYNIPYLKTSAKVALDPANPLSTEFLFTTILKQTHCLSSQNQVNIAAQSSNSPVHDSIQILASHINELATQDNTHRRLVNKFRGIQQQYTYFKQDLMMLKAMHNDQNNPRFAQHKNSTKEKYNHLSQHMTDIDNMLLTPNQKIIKYITPTLTILVSLGLSVIGFLLISNIVGLAGVGVGLLLGFTIYKLINVYLHRHNQHIFGKSENNPNTDIRCLIGLFAVKVREFIKTNKPLISHPTFN